jgi:carbon monoxide dehydrogenase subunit G
VQLENSFEVPADLERVWSYLLDVERVVPCMPGAELTETVDDRTWKGKVTIKLGPVSMAFAGKVHLAERDDAGHRAVLEASGMETRGKGAASAKVTTTAEQADGGTRVRVAQDLKIQGQAAQVARGMMDDVTAKLTQQFADCLKANLGTEEEAAPAERPAVAAQPVGGLGLAWGALWNAFIRLLNRVFAPRSRR